MRLLNPISPPHLNIEVESSDNRHFINTPMDFLETLVLVNRVVAPLKLLPPLCTDPWLDRPTDRVQKDPFPNRRQ